MLTRTLTKNANAMMPAVLNDFFMVIILQS
jgi:hypothetical protein